MLSHLVSEEYSIAIIKTAGTCNRTRQPATAVNGHQCDYEPDSITRSAILVLRQAQKIAGGKISGFREKIVYMTKLPGSKCYRIQSSHFKYSGFKITEDMAKPGCFYVRFVLLYASGKTNPVLKRSGFVTNLEQFPLV